MTIQEEIVKEIESVEHFVADAATKITEVLTASESVAIDFTKMDPAHLIDMGIQLLTVLKNFFPVIDRSETNQ